MRTTKCCTIVSYKYIGGVGEEGKEEPPLKDFPPDLRDSEICLSLGATRGAKAICYLGRRARPGQPSQKCPLGGSRGGAMEPGYPEDSGLLPAPGSWGINTGGRKAKGCGCYVTSFKDRQGRCWTFPGPAGVCDCPRSPPPLVGSCCLSLPPDLGSPTYSPGTENKILSSMPSLTTISLLRMGSLEWSSFKPLFSRAIKHYLT